MFESKYSKFLTIILIVVIIAILGLLGFWVYDSYTRMNTEKDAAEYVDNYQGGTANRDNNTDNDGSSTDTNSILEQLTDTPISNNSSNSGKKEQYKGFNVVGTMDIPAINFHYPVLEKVTRQSLETSVAVLYPSGESLNQPGNTIVVGHNYRNGLFFSNNKKLSIGDKISVTDYRGTKLTYTIYNKFEADQNDTSFYQRDTAGKAELTLSTCTDASNNMRLIIFAKAD